MVLISGSYLVYLWESACLGNISWKYMNSMIFFVWVYEGSKGSKGVGAWLRAPKFAKNVWS